MKNNITSGKEPICYMTAQKLLFLILIFFYASTNLNASEYKTFSLIISPEGNPTLLWDGKSYPLKTTQDNWLLFTKDLQLQKDLTANILASAQLIWRISQKQDKTKIKQIIEEITSHYNVAQYQLIETSIEIATSLNNINYLKELMEIANDPDLAAEIYLRGSLLEKSLETKKKLLKKALALSPSKTKKSAQHFSLSVACALLNYTQKELLKAGIYRTLDMENKDPSYALALKEVIFNTAHSLTLILTNSEKNLFTIWESQINQIERTKLIIQYLMKSLEEGKDLLESFDYKNLLSLDFYAHGELDSFFQSPFLKDLLRDGIYSDEIIDGKVIPYPSLTSLNLKFNVDFLSYDWKTIAIGQCNALNIWMFTLLPKQLKTFGATKYGKWVVDTFRLQRFLNVLRKVPRPFDSVAVLLAIETADGCTVRWVYTAFVAHDKLTQNSLQNTQMQIEESLKKIKK